MKILITVGITIIFLLIFIGILYILIKTIDFVMSRLPIKIKKIIIEYGGCIGVALLIFAFFCALTYSVLWTQ